MIIQRRRVLRGALGASAFGAGALHAPAVIGQAKGPYAGTTINASCFQTTYFEYLKNYFPEFEERTGIKVNFTMQAFPVYNQRTDLELSTRGSALDLVLPPAEPSPMRITRRPRCISSISKKTPRSIIIKS